MDANQKEIVAALRQVGAGVIHMHTLGMDIPDLLVAYRGRTMLMEVKMPRHEPTNGQRVFMFGWPGESHVVHSVDEALRAVGAA